MKRLLFMLFLACTVSLVQAGNKVPADLYNYEVEPYGGVSVQPGYILMKIWTYGKRKDLTNNYFMQNAIHAILFKGCPDSGTTAGVTALVPEGYEAHKDFFDNFFHGKFLQYIQLSNNGSREAGDVVQLKSGRYKIGTVVLINLKGLRTYLEQEHIIKPLDFLFK